MTAALRLIFELLESTGSDPTIQVDTDEMSPPTFSDLVARLDQAVAIGPSVVNQAVALSAACLVVLVSDQPVTLKLASGETAMAVRFFCVAGKDKSGTALPATSILLSGNGSSTANVRIYALGKV
jgi:hypothetical protein